MACLRGVRQATKVLLLCAEAGSSAAARLAAFEQCTGTASLLLGSTMASGLRSLLDKPAVAVAGLGMDLAAASDLLSSLAKLAATSAAYSLGQQWQAAC